MRTGKIGLNSFLAAINRAETDRCPCGQAPAETPHHVLLGSLGNELYDDLRREIWRGAAPRDLAEALSEKKHARLAVKFMLRTGRLAFTADTATRVQQLRPTRAVRVLFPADSHVRDSLSA
jgi:hypothetical protein